MYFAMHTAIDRAFGLFPLYTVGRKSIGTPRFSANIFMKTSDFRK